MNEAQAAAAVQQLVIELENMAVILKPYIEVENALENDETILCERVNFSGWPEIEGYGEVNLCVRFDPDDEDIEALFFALFGSEPLLSIPVSADEFLLSKLQAFRKRLLAVLNERLTTINQSFHLRLVAATAVGSLLGVSERKHAEATLLDVVRDWEPMFEVVHQNAALPVEFYDEDLGYILPKEALERIAAAAEAAAMSPTS
jgi:hypothetical protein